ncbi:hypothetical protein [Mycolicibacterium iranicum]|jgi:hypothetical protein|uniref:PASTA domain-containing protein n=1 Tax=Mycolicibacterium iranicum TaxID=912594 RepID=A0A1X1W792_MYCIR|nr:hypothetical protein [Mycolicibacterium iranicum]MCZ0727806.1 hypothetical protein [Mycolicibacterium iranicum]ORV82401.1 hypothetical protein AWC12_27735 [Mycolicibacterium iranicum]
MNRLIFAAGACSAALAASVTFSGAAFADPEEPAPAVDGTASQGPSAAAEIARLQSEGKSVQVVGNDGAAPLESCDVAKTTEGEVANTVMVEVTCPITDF